ncbi:lysophospholipid acyltransferase family protein [Microlunatus flavus]|uniref:lysophospholipid acyltransferase family protein n=1 Tax=Microlunatus flavus TaxID=1036181 RepID=UPI0018E09538|nr:lysophospholipid acyltransferase family protein [Microlunatus flavus]
MLNAVLEPLSRRDWQGQDRLPATGGVIVVANHISNADPLALGQFLAYSGRWPRFLAKSSLFGVPGLGRLLRRVQQIPVERGSSRSSDALAAARAALEDGQAVVVYPEGTITRDPDLWPMRGRTGAARLALATAYPVVPVAQWGAEEFLRGPRLGLPRLWARPTLRMRVGPPVDLGDLRGRPLDAALLAEATERIMAALTGLLEDLRGEPAPAVRFDPRPGGRPGVGAP